MESSVLSVFSAPLLALNTAVSPGLSPAELSRFFDHAPMAHSPAPPAPPVAAALPAARTPPAFARTFRVLLAHPERARRYDGLIRAEAEKRGLDARLVKAIVAAESEFTARARSPAGALGLMQVMPRTAESVGVDRGALFEPAANVRAGTSYLAYLFARAWKRYGIAATPFAQSPRWLIERVIAAYNAGPRFLKKRPLYRQTRDYVRKVMLYLDSRVTDI
jgi:soluble lytic murein transglycosylase-like protein